jgi:hypothetical protein
MLKHPDTAQQFAGNGFEPQPGSVDAFRKYFLAEVRKWKRVISEAAIAAN